MENENKKRRSLFSRLTFSTAALIVSLLLLMSYLSVVINPAKAWFMTVFGLLYIPFLFLAVLFFFWALFRGSRSVGLLLLALLPSIFIAGRFVQFGREEREPSERAVKMVTYNVGLFAHGDREGTGRQVLADSVVAYLRRTDADIICLQEFYMDNGRDIRSYLQQKFPGYQIEYYVLTGANGAAGNVTLSRFPMANKGKIDFEHSTNLAIYTDLDIKGTCVRIYNCHFESYNISLPRVIQSFVHDDTAVEDASHKMKRSIVARPKQVDQVMQDIEACPLRCVVTGDFNDNPLSYTYVRLKRGRKDAFVSAGRGVGATHRAFWPLLRIDYILYPDDLEAIRYEVERTWYSDHYPVFTVFEPQYQML